MFVVPEKRARDGNPTDRTITASMVGDKAEQIPSFNRHLAKDQRLTHLRIVVSAEQLAEYLTTAGLRSQGLLIGEGFASAKQRLLLNRTSR
jgi:hypothetical protein